MPCPANAASPCNNKGRTCARFNRLALNLLGAHLADHDRVDAFEVRRVGGQRQVNDIPVEITIIEVPR
jgi:hypothetical protein